MNYALRYFRAGETSRIEIKDDSERDDKPLKELLLNSDCEQKYDPGLGFFMEIRLIRIFKVVDMKQDGTCLLKNIRYGKGELIKDASLSIKN